MIEAAAGGIGGGAVDAAAARFRLSEDRGDLGLMEPDDFWTLRIRGLDKFEDVATGDIFCECTSCDLAPSDNIFATTSSSSEPPMPLFAPV